MKQMGKWLLMMTKRLYKKLTFLLILLLIPILVFGYSVAAEEESGLLTVALAREGEDPYSGAVVQELLEENGLVRFILCETPESARNLIQDGKADAAWIFHADMEEKVCKFVLKPSKRNGFITVIEAEDTVYLKMTREKLSGVVFKHCSPVFYLSYIRENVPELDGMTDEELMEFYDGFAKDIRLFEYAYLEDTVENTGENDYLLAPVRGLLAVIIVLGGLAAAMYYIRDEQTGTFSLVPQGKKARVEFGCQMIAALNTGIVAWISLGIAGLAGSWGRELLLLLLYCVCVSLFCMTVRRLCGGLTAMGTALPLLVVVMLVVCPVLLDLGALRPLQRLFPPTYYINGAVSDQDLLLMCGYNLILLAVYTLTGKILQKK